MTDLVINELHDPDLNIKLQDCNATSTESTQSTQGCSEVHTKQFGSSEIYKPLLAPFIYLQINMSMACFVIHYNCVVKDLTAL